MSFENLGLSADILRRLTKRLYRGYPHPGTGDSCYFAKGRDIMAGAQTGTGKNSGFTLPLLQRLSENIKPRASQTSGCAH